MADFNNQTIHLDGGLTRTLATADTVTFNVAGFTVQNSLTVGGNLDVAGNIIARDEERVLVQDNFLDVNFGYGGTSFQSGGINVVYKAVASGTSVNSSSNNITFAAADGTTGRAQVSLATTTALPADTFSAGDLVQIAGTTNAENDGIYIVHDQSAAGVIIVKSTNLTSPDAYNFLPAQVDFTAETESASTDVSFTHVNCTTLQLDSSGTWVTSSGNADSDFATSGDLGSSSLQEAYDTGNTISTASSTDIAFTLASGGFVVNGGGAVDFGSAGANVASFDVAADGAVNFGASADSSFSVSGADLALSAVDLVLTSTTLMDVNANVLDVDASGAIQLDAGAASNLSTSAGALTLAGAAGVTVTSTGGTLVLNASGQTADLDAASLDADFSADFNILAGAGSAIATSAGDLDILAFANLDLDGATVDIDSAGALSLDAGAASNLSTSAGALTLDGAAGVNIQGNAAEIDVTTTGALDINSGAATVDADSFVLTSGGVTTLSSQAGTLTLNAAGQTLDADAAAVDIASTGGMAYTAATSSKVELNANSGNIETLLLKAVNSGAGDGHVVIQSDAQVELKDGTATLKLDGGVLSETGMVSAEISPSGAVDLIAGAASQFTTSAGALSLTGAAGVTVTSTGGQLTLDGSGQTVDLNAATLDVDGGAMAFDGSEFHVGHNAALDVDIDATAFEVDATGALSLDSAVASNFTITAATGLDEVLLLKATNSGAGAGVVSVEGDRVDLESGAINIGVEPSAGSAINIGEATQANPITMDAGTDSMVFRADAGIRMDDLVAFNESAGAVFKNSTGSTLAAGRVVYMSGNDGTNPEISLADSSSDHHPIGITVVSVPSGATKVVGSICGAIIRGLSIAGASVNNGDAVFLNGTSISTEAPTSGTVYRLGYVAKAGGGSNADQIIWRPQFIAKIA